MRVFAIADPHLSKAQAKPMDIFGGNWQGHPEVFFERWRETVREEDLVLIPGDISWAMQLEDALLDLGDIATLPGKKVLLRGNHDYWWSAIGKVRKILPEHMYALQNDALFIDGVVIAGTRGWTCPGNYEFTEEDQKIYVREVERLNLSLQAAKKLKGDKFVVMLHFPPTNFRLEPSGFTELLLKAKPDAVVFGHLHGEKVAVPKLGETAVHFVAADALGFKPKQIF
jgi:uncharacterized protein